MHSMPELQSELRGQTREILARDPEHERDILGGFVSELFLILQERQQSSQFPISSGLREPVEIHSAPVV